MAASAPRTTTVHTRNARTYAGVVPVDKTTIVVKLSLRFTLVYLDGWATKTTHSAVRQAESLERLLRIW